MRKCKVKAKLAKCFICDEQNLWVCSWYLWNQGKVHSSHNWYLVKADLSSINPTKMHGQRFILNLYLRHGPTLEQWVWGSQGPHFWELSGCSWSTGGEAAAAVVLLGAALLWRGSWGQEVGTIHKSGLTPHAHSTIGALHTYNTALWSFYCSLVIPWIKLKSLAQQFYVRVCKITQHVYFYLK